MRILLILLIITCNLHASEKLTMPIQNINTINESQDKWSLLQYTPNDSVEIWFFRKNVGLNTNKEKQTLSVMVYFTIEFIPKDDTGLPNLADSKILYEFEDEIIPKIEKEAGGMFVASVIKSGLKDHLFYISDPDLFLKIIGKYKSHLSTLNYSLEKVDDPNWGIYKDFPDGT